MSNVTLYLFGTLLVAIGLAYGVNLFLGPVWAMVTGAVVFGFGMMGAVDNGRRREPSPGD